MDCTDLNSDEAVSYFKSAFPNYSASNYDEYDDLKEAIQNPIIIDTIMEKYLNMPDDMIFYLDRRLVGVLTNKNPLLIYTYTKALNDGKLQNDQVYIHEDFRGFLANDMYVIYCGDNYKLFFSIKPIYQGSNFTIFPITHEDSNLYYPWLPFSSPLMIDITELVCGKVGRGNFLNWLSRNPMEVKE